MKTIPLSRGKFAIVDDEDYEWLMHWKWSCTAHNYAVRAEGPKCKRKFIYMHREILKTQKGIIDHVNNDKLDNRKINLRNCNKSENATNSPKPSNNTSGYKGVYWNKRASLWMASIKYKYKQIHLGYFKTSIEAARAYNDAAIKYHGEFAKLNRILED